MLKLDPRALATKEVLEMPRIQFELSRGLFALFLSKKNHARTLFAETLFTPATSREIEEIYKKREKLNSHSSTLLVSSLEMHRKTINKRANSELIKRLSIKGQKEKPLFVDVTGKPFYSELLKQPVFDNSYFRVFCAMQHPLLLSKSLRELKKKLYVVLTDKNQADLFFTAFANPRKIISVLNSKYELVEFDLVKFVLQEFDFDEKQKKEFKKFLASFNQ